MYALRRTAAILFFPAIAWLGAGCDKMDAPTEATAPVAPSFSSDDNEDGGRRRTFVYTNNDAFVANTVSGFRVGPDGSLTPVPGSPFPTGGQGSQGGFFASVRATVTLARNFLFISNTFSNNISVFRIDRSTGSLTPVPGSPFATGGVGGIGISMGVTPNNRFLYAGNASSNNISAFRIASNGALTPVPGSPFPAPPGNPDGVKVSWNGRFLSVALPNAFVGTPAPVGIPPGALAMFRIASNGALTPVPGSPFLDNGAGVAAGSDIDCRTRFLFAGEAGGATTVDVFRIASTGALMHIPGSAFNFVPGSNSNVGVLSPNDRFLFVSNQNSNTITVLNVAGNGSLSQVPGSPFSNSGGFLPSGEATNRAGNLLYVANYNNTVTGFQVAGDGTLTPVPGSPFSTAQPDGGLLSLTVYPAKNCHDVGDDDDDDNGQRDHGHDDGGNDD